MTCLRTLSPCEGNSLKEMKNRNLLSCPTSVKRNLQLGTASASIILVVDPDLHGDLLQQCCMLAHACVHDVDVLFLLDFAELSEIHDQFLLSVKTGIKKKK